MTTLDQIVRKQREDARRRQHIVEALAKRGSPQDAVAVSLPRALVERLRRFADIAGAKGDGTGQGGGGARASAEVLLEHALDQAEPLFAPGPKPAPKYPTRANGARP